MFFQNKYEKIIKMICDIRGVEREELLVILEEEECRNLLFLMLKKYNCLDEEKIRDDFKIENIKSKSKVAEEKFFINKEFRDTYFEVVKAFERNNII
ncbi:ribose-5-phosphate isomerase [Hathewaya massiliensis]|uniref:ribose-5-phosphate isomerase n=1 Tax=Hathewaya massiliensis TaxID=1964382 RepID=UPI0011582433|nr:ribose-5-phosphate isomerase [Hathewaya massiliensis]